MSRKCSRKKKIERAVDDVECPVQCVCNAHVASGFFAKIISNNVDFQLFLTQILHLNLKRVINQKKRVKIVGDDMEYLDKVLGVKVTYEDVEFKHLPNFIVTRYRLQMASMNGKNVIFLYPKTELEQIEVLKKHIARIQNNENWPVVLVLKELSFRQKEYLIREKIPFIVDGKQIYLPFMAVYLQERCSAEKMTREEILPSAQMLLLHFIYGSCNLRILRKHCSKKQEISC